MGLPLRRRRITMGVWCTYMTGEYTGSSSDPDFGFVLEHSLRIRRHTEYCEWRESSRTACETCTDSEGKRSDCNCKRTYYYTKSWYAHHLSSLGFDQAANHHNPNHNPYPSAIFGSENTKKKKGFGVLALVTRNAEDRSGLSYSPRPPHQHHQHCEYT